MTWKQGKTGENKEPKDTYSLFNKNIDKMMFITVTNEATTAMVMMFLLSSFDEVWAFGVFELLFFEIVENSFVLAVVIGFRVIGVFEAVFLVGVGDW